MTEQSISYLPFYPFSQTSDSTFYIDSTSNNNTFTIDSTNHITNIVWGEMTDTKYNTYNNSQVAIKFSSLEAIIIAAKFTLFMNINDLMEIPLDDLVALSKEVMADTSLHLKK